MHASYTVQHVWVTWVQSVCVQMEGSCLPPDCQHQLRKRKTNWKYKSRRWHRPSPGIPVAIFLYHLCLRDICHAQRCKTHKFFWVYKSLCLVTKCHCLLGYFSWDHLNKCNSHHHKTLISFRNNIVRVILFLLTQHIVILWHECNVAHSACGNVFSSIANESNPAAWCVV